MNEKMNSLKDHHKESKHLHKSTIITKKQSQFYTKTNTTKEKKTRPTHISLFENLLT